MHPVRVSNMVRDLEMSGPLDVAQVFRERIEQYLAHTAYT